MKDGKNKYEYIIILLPSLGIRLTCFFKKDIIGTNFTKGDNNGKDNKRGVDF